MPTTMVQPEVILRSGRRRRSSRPNATADSTGAAAPTTRPVRNAFGGVSGTGRQSSGGVTVFVEARGVRFAVVGQLLAAIADALAADVIVIADSDNWSTDVRR